MKKCGDLHNLKPDRGRFFDTGVPKRKVLGWSLNLDGILTVKPKSYSKYYALVQSDQKESKSKQALQIIGHVVAESCANAWA
jgi:hypothetical protein